MNEAAWGGHIQQFKDLLRYPVQDDETGVRRDRQSDIASLHDRLPDLLFESYSDWFDQADDWLLRNMSLILTDDQDAQLRSLLSAGDDGMVLTYLADTCLPAWQQAAAEGGAFAPTAGDDGGSAERTGTENSANWAASRTPGTYYYTFDGAQYRYSDKKQAGDAEWQALRVREEEAAAQAQPWGNGGAWCTPAHDSALYGDTHVYALDREGPWLSREDALRQLAASAGSPSTQPAPDQQQSEARSEAQSDAQSAAKPVAWGTVWTNLEGGAWVYGLTEQGPWSYADGTVALAERKLLDDVLEQLAVLLPDTDPGTLREMAVRQLAATSSEGGH